MRFTDFRCFVALGLGLCACGNDSGANGDEPAAAASSADGSESTTGDPSGASGGTPTNEDTESPVGTDEMNGGGGPVGDAGEDMNGVGTDVEPSETPALGDGEPTPLPASEGVEYRGIVNLVDTDAAYELEQLMFAPEDSYFTMELATRLFYLNYEDEYDFLFLILDHDLPSAPVDGLHQLTNSPYLLGTGLEEPISTGLGPANLLAAISILPNEDNRFPPFAHEVMHTFGVALSSEFGFPSAPDVPFLLRHHWGMIGVDAHLGGFDPDTLECQTPGGAVPPSCEAGDDGLTRYLVEPFLPNTDLFDDRPYAPLELYLMGLLPKEEVPQPILRFDGAPTDTRELELSGDKLVVEAMGISEFTMADIVARHGEVPLLAEGDRHYRAAFALVSSEPAPRERLDEVVRWAALFGGEDVHSDERGAMSFSEMTGGRATLSWRVGEQRVREEDEYLEFVGPFVDMCDHLAQDCPDGLTCMGKGGRYCAVAGTGQVGTPCGQDWECLPGSLCARVLSTFDTQQCAPYCDHENAEAENSCDVLCPGNFSPMYHGETFEELGAFCFGGVGGRCDPLADDCDAGQACAGTSPPACEPPGDKVRGEECYIIDNQCAAGLACVRASQEDDYFCEAYCDVAPDAPAESACGEVCPLGVINYDSFGVCLPG